MSDVTAINNLVTKHAILKKEIAKIIIGQTNVVEQILLSVYTGGHSLLIGVPGLAKTLMVHTIAQALGLDFKTQAALLEAMQERTVTIAGVNYKLPAPYFVLATQNPIEQEGTYPLPEAQLDRFMFAIELQYPSVQEEIDIVKSTTSDIKYEINALFTADEILAIQQLIRRIPVPDNVVDYAVKLVNSTRPNLDSASDYVKQYIDWGAGPRASQNLILGAKAHAAIHGKYSPDIEDVKAVAYGILRHRIIKNYKAEAEGISDDTIISNLL